MAIVVELLQILPYDPLVNSLVAFYDKTPMERDWVVLFLMFEITGKPLFLYPYMIELLENYSDIREPS